MSNFMLSFYLIFKLNMYFYIHRNNIFKVLHVVILKYQQIISRLSEIFVNVSTSFFKYLSSRAYQIIFSFDYTILTLS